MSEALSESIQHYLREIYKLHAEHGTVTVTALARRLNVSDPSASAMVKKLSALELAQHERYRGVELTAAGERVALEVIRHHRLLELYLAETLGLAVDDVHDEADRLEHALSEELEESHRPGARVPDARSARRPDPDANLKWPELRRRPKNQRSSGPSSSLRTNGFMSTARPSSSETLTSSSSASFARSSASSSS